MFSHLRSSFSRHQTYQSAFVLSPSPCPPSIPICLNLPPCHHPQNATHPSNLLPLSFDSSTFAGCRNQMRAAFDLCTCANSSSSSMRESDTCSGSHQAGDQGGIGYGHFSSLFICFCSSSVLASPPFFAIPHATLIHQELPLLPLPSTLRPLLCFQTSIRHLQSPCPSFSCSRCCTPCHQKDPSSLSLFSLLFPLLRSPSLVA